VLSGLAIRRKVLVLIWDNAPWHTSKHIRDWIHAYNQAAKVVFGCREKALG
jgi:hypothetical protein